MTHQIRPAHVDGENPQAVEAAVALLGQSVPAAANGLVPYHAAGYHRYIAAALVPAPPLRTLLIRTVVHAGKLVAVADWRVLDFELFLNGLSVREDYRGQGHGRRLLLDGIEMAKELGIGVLGLDVACDNPPALALYRRSGFTEVDAASWLDLADYPADCANNPVRVVDWPAFQAHRAAYGFGDLKIRHGVGTVTSIRMIGSAMRVGWDDRSVLPMRRLRPLLGASRVYTIGQGGASSAKPPFARFTRMKLSI